jgi:hypothetical protein
MDTKNETKKNLTDDDIDHLDNVWT